MLLKNTSKENASKNASRVMHGRLACNIHRTYNVWDNEIVEKLGDVLAIYDGDQNCRVRASECVSTHFYRFCGDYIPDHIRIAWHQPSVESSRVSGSLESQTARMLFFSYILFLLISRRILKKKIIGCFSLNINNSYRESPTFQVQIKRVCKCYYKLLINKQ